MLVNGAACAFCGTTGMLVSTAVLDEKWSRRFGGDPVVALDHGWYRTVHGERVVADRARMSKFFRPYSRAVCDYCAHGWIEDVRWRAEPWLLAMAERRSPQSQMGVDHSALVRWSHLTAMLAELLDGMPSASSATQRQAVRRNVTPAPVIGTWFFSTRQRLPARVHLSQVPLNHTEPGAGLVQIVSVDLAHFTTLVILPSDDESLQLVQRSAVEVELGTGTPAVGDSDWTSSVRPLDLSRTPHPHRIAVHRLCAASSATLC